MEGWEESERERGVGARQMDRNDNDAIMQSLPNLKIVLEVKKLIVRAVLR